MKKIILLCILIIVSAPIFAEKIQKNKKQTTSHIENKFTPITIKNIKKFEKQLLQLGNEHDKSPTILSLLGKLYLAKNNPQKALIYYKKALKLAPNQAINHAQLAICYTQLKNISDAKYHSKKALAIGKLNPELTAYLKLIINRSSKIKVFEKFSKSNQAIILSLFILFLSIIFHEVAHGYTALKLGDPTARDAGRISFNPFVHIDIVGSIILPAILIFTKASLIFGWAKPVPFNPENFRNKKKGKILVAIAGPASNILLMCVGIIIIKFAQLINANMALFFLGIQFMTINLFLSVLNLLPIPPLDGSHVVANLLPQNISEKYQKIGIFGMGLMVFVLNSSFFHKLTSTVFKTFFNLFKLHFS